MLKKSSRLSQMNKNDTRKRKLHVPKYSILYLKLNEPLCSDNMLDIYKVPRLWRAAKGQKLPPNGSIKTTNNFHRW